MQHKIEDVLKNIEYHSNVNLLDLKVNDLKINSKNVEKDDMFIAIQGKKGNGYKFVREAIERGASVILLNEEYEKEIENLDVPCVFVNNTNLILPCIAKNVYRIKEDIPFNLIGVTGTNGKTSVTTITKRVFRKMGYDVGLIGTIDNYINENRIEIETTTATTPDCIELEKIMSTFIQENVDDVIMEVSSMALKRNRVNEWMYDIGVFLNISPEHLDDHGDMDDYLKSKKELLFKSKIAIVNKDDRYYDYMVEGIECDIISFGVGTVNKADIYATDIKYSNTGVSFFINYNSKRQLFTADIPCEFAIYNTLAVVAICLQKGIDLETIAFLLQGTMSVDGRYDIIPNDRCTVIIDYAHTPAALENLLSAIRKNSLYNRVITVFGCGGDRDKSKRAPMGQISQIYSDIVIVTSDNPRTENMYEIIKDINKGMQDKKVPYYNIIDRKAAIEYAIWKANRNDVIVIAGKGHECEQVIGMTQRHFSDKSVAKWVLESEKVTVMTDLILKLVCESLELKEIGCDENLCNLNINSMDYIRMISILEKYFNIEFEDDMLSIKFFKKVGDLIDCIKYKLEEKS